MIEDGSISSANIDDATIVTGDIASTTITNAKLVVDPSNATNLNAGDVPAAQLDNVDTAGLSDDIALTGFKVAANGSLSKYSLRDQTLDAFEDATGVDASASTNELRDSSGKYYSGSADNAVVTSGGSSAIDGDYTVTTFTADGTFVTDTAQVYDLLVVAGGGTGGANGGGGGGGGGVRYITSFPVAAASYAVDSGSGSNQFSTIYAQRGGDGGGSDANPGGQGGSGGGTAGGGNVGAGNYPAYTPVQGYPGGGGGSHTGGGGGGGSEAGSAADRGSQTPTAGGPGGDGLQVAITGTPTYFGGGGGGGVHRSLSPGLGGIAGQGGGATGGNYGQNGTAPSGTANTGGGGGGGGGTEYVASGWGGPGGSGIVILRRPTTDASYENMTLTSNLTAANAAPTKGDIVFTYSNGAGTAVINTNITAEISADNGSTWTLFSGLATEGTTGGHTIVSAHNQTITSTITAPYNMKYRIKTLVQSVSMQTRIHAVSLGWS